MYFVQIFTGIMVNYNLCTYRLSSHAGSRINNPGTTHSGLLWNMEAQSSSAWDGLGYTTSSEEIAFIICHHISLGMHSTSPYYSFSYKQLWKVNTNNSFSDEDIEVSNWRMM